MMEQKHPLPPFTCERISVVMNTDIITQKDNGSRHMAMKTENLTKTDLCRDSLQA